MTSRTYRVGIAGLSHGHVGQHLRSWSELSNVELVGYAEGDPELRAKYANRLSGTTAYDSVEQLLDTGKPDIISICNETINHAPVVEMAAERGIHCIMEKPMAISLYE